MKLYANIHLKPGLPLIFAQILNYLKLSDISKARTPIINLVLRYISSFIRSLKSAVLGLPLIAVAIFLFISLLKRIIISLFSYQ